MIATHEALCDIFPAYAVTAALVTASITPKSPSIPINALALHIFLKLAVYLPAYLLEFDLVRTYSHIQISCRLRLFSTLKFELDANPMVANRRRVGFAGLYYA
ncbi:hypothetical protein DFH07DRAFT_838191 [Mycena maculata]|uniref:Uncharacterized protein n=1 Tax=Mycena maculata TaxID=230809 RepID=A0AAD7N2E8_9AGAR|nr:hypothetical protein DFH07DRAFT_838191 [Mycena maculata]